MITSVGAEKDDAFAPECEVENECEWETVPDTTFGNKGGITYEQRCCNCQYNRRVDTWDQEWSGDGEPHTTYIYTLHAREVQDISDVVPEADGTVSVTAHSKPFADEPPGVYQFILDGDQITAVSCNGNQYSLDDDYPTRALRKLKDAVEQELSPGGWDR